MGAARGGGHSGFERLDAGFAEDLHSARSPTTSLRRQAPHASSHTAVFGSSPGTEVNLRAPRHRGHTTVALEAPSISRICVDSAGEKGTRLSGSGMPQRALDSARIQLMNPTLLTWLMAVLFLAGLALVALGLPGLWVMVVAVVAYGWLTAFERIGLMTIAVVVGLAGVGEVLEAWLGFGLARRYGGSTRAGWGALLGGLVGAVVGVPVPVIGSVIGAFIGSFAGAVIFEYWKSDASTAVRAGWGALLGRAAATAAKIAVGLVIAVVALFAAVRG